jgi:transcriptional regulator with XRE-family HTH domain
MAGHKSWKTISDRLGPQRRAKIEKKVREELGGMVLSELRRQTGKTQVELAKALGIQQPAISQLESQSDMQISTLQRIIAKLGGTLDLVVTLPSGKFSLSQFGKEKTGGA